jgi:hypothetical protein
VSKVKYRLRGRLRDYLILFDCPEARTVEASSWFKVCHGALRFGTQRTCKSQVVGGLLLCQVKWLTISFTSLLSPTLHFGMLLCIVTMITPKALHSSKTMTSDHKLREC